MPTTPPLRPPDPPAPPSLPHLLGRLADDVPGLLRDRVRLLTLELRRASQALGKMVVLGLAAAILAITAWAALWIGLAAAAVLLGWHWGWVALAAVLLNGLLAGLAVRRVIALAPLLALPATVRRLTRGLGEEDEDAAHPDGLPGAAS